MFETSSNTVKTAFSTSFYFFQTIFDTTHWTTTWVWVFRSFKAAKTFPHFFKTTHWTTASFKAFKTFFDPAHCATKAWFQAFKTTFDPAHCAKKAWLCVFKTTCSTLFQALDKPRKPWFFFVHIIDNGFKGPRINSILKRKSQNPWDLHMEETMAESEKTLLPGVCCREPAARSPLPGSRKFKMLED